MNEVVPIETGININKPTSLSAVGREFLKELNKLFGFCGEEMPEVDTDEKKEILQQWQAQRIADETRDEVGNIGSAHSGGW